MQLILSALPDFLRAAVNTLIYCAVSFPIALLLGLAIATMIQSRFIWLKIPARTFVEVMRSTPLITQVLMLYYGAGAVLVNFNLSTLANAWVVGIVSLALNYAAYEAEVFRAGFLSVDSGQTEAALSLGLTSKQKFFRIILPQAVPLMLPPLVNDFIYMIKDSAVVTVISGTELTSVLQFWTIRNSSNPLPLFALALILYLLLSLPISYIGRFFESRLRTAL